MAGPSSTASSSSSSAWNRHQQWCARWMLASTARDTRWHEIERLLGILQDDVVSQAFEDLADILRFELFCRHADLARQDAISPTVTRRDSAVGTLLDAAAAAPRDQFRPVLDANRVGRIVRVLCEPLIKLEYSGAHLDAILHSRALGLALLLLRAHDVTEIQTEYSDALNSRVKTMFNTLRGRRDSLATDELERYQKFEGSYLLYGAAQYAKEFKRANPIALETAKRALLLINIGLQVASPAMGGGPPNLSGIVQSFSEAFAPLSTSQTDHFKALSRLQEWTSHALTLNLFAHVALQSQHHKALAPNAAVCSHTLAHFTLKESVNIIDRLGYNLKGPKQFLEYLSATANRGPGDFREYHLLYGAMDCASRTVRLTQPQECKSLLDPRLQDTKERLTRHMRNMTLDCKEPSYRLKAISYLIHTEPSYLSLESQLLDTDIKPAQRRQIKREIEALSAGDRIKKVNSGSSRSPSTDSNESRASMTLVPGDWREKPVEVRVSTSSHSVSLPLPRSRVHLAGLSDTCKSAFFLSASQLSVYSWPTLPPTSSSCTLRLKRDGQYIQAALSDRYVAAFSAEQLVVAVLPPNRNTRIVEGTKTFDTPSNERRWNPHCLALYEAIGEGDDDASNELWIAVGGNKQEKDGVRGSIRIYRASEADGSVKIESIPLQPPPPRNQNCNLHNLRGPIKSIQFSPNGIGLVCTTTRLTQDSVLDRVLIWFLSESGHPRRSAPIVLAQSFGQAPDAGITSASIFFGTSRNPYVLCTTWPSPMRGSHNGEWSFISPVPHHPSISPSDLQHQLMALGGSTGPIIAGTVCPVSNLVALIDTAGAIHLVAMSAADPGGLQATKAIKLDRKLCKQSLASSTALRFCEDDARHCVFYALDVKGHLVWKDLGRLPDLEP